MRIIHILEKWGDGGTEVYVETLVKALDELGCSSRVVVLSGEPPQGNWVGGPVSLEAKGFNRFDKMRRYFASLNEPVIAHLHLSTGLLSAALAARMYRSKVKSLATFHLPVSIWHWRHRFAFRLTCRLVDAVAGGSEFTAGELRRWRDDVVVCSPPIVFPEQSSIPQKEHDCFRISGCGRLAKQKDWGTLIRAFAAARDQLPPNSLCEIIGEGPERPLLENLIDELNLQSILNLRGQLDHEIAMTEIQKADLFVLPSLFEGFGMSAVEAMALGVPTIVADYPAGSEYVKHDETGHLFARGDYQNLAELLVQHAGNSEWSSKLGRRASRFVRQLYSPDRIASIYMQLYQKILS